MPGQQIAAKRRRIHGDIKHFAARLESIGEPSTPQERRQHTIAARCLKRRVESLLRLSVQTKKGRVVVP